MGVNPGGDGGDESPPEFGVGGTIMQIVPPRFFHFVNFKRQIACVIYHSAYYKLAVIVISDNRTEIFAKITQYNFSITPKIIVNY